MTLRELSPEYQKQAQILRSRIKELEALCKQTTNTSTRERLQNRIRTLSELYREARDLATLTERYYERGFKRNGKYKYSYKICMRNKIASTPLTLQPLKNKKPLAKELIQS